MKVILASIYSRMNVKIDPTIEMKQFFHCGVAQPKNVAGSIAQRI